MILVSKLLLSRHFFYLNILCLSHSGFLYVKPDDCLFFPE